MTTPAVGRPRSAEAEHAAITAAELIVSESGLDALTFQSISHRSGVSRSTLYKWWPTPVAVLFDALMRDTAIADPPEDVDVRVALAQQMRGLLSLLTDTGTAGAVARGVLTRGVEDPRLAAALRDYWWGPRRSITRRILDRGVRLGRVRDVPRETAIDLLFGPIYFRALYGLGSLQDELVEEILDSCGLLVDRR